MKKLLKIDLISTLNILKTFAIIVGCTVIIAPIFVFLFTNSLDNSDVGMSLFSGLMIMVLYLFGISSIVIVISRLSKYINNTLFFKQGYLTLTLPYKTWQIVMSKILTFIIIFCSSLLIGIIAFSLTCLETYGLLILKYDSNVVKDFFSTFFSMFTQISFYPGGDNIPIFVSVLQVINSILVLPTFVVAILAFDTILYTNFIKKPSKGKYTMICILTIFIVSIICGIYFSILLSNLNFREYLIVNSVVTTIVFTAITIGGFFLINYLIDYRLEI